MARRAAVAPERARERRAPQAGAGRAAVAEAAGLDGVIHERARLAIVSALAVNPCMRFGDLKALLGLSDGNLSVHARRLEEAGYVAVEKSFEGRVPRTDFRLTAAGRLALERYVVSIETLVRTLRRAER